MQAERGAVSDHKLASDSPELRQHWLLLMAQCMEEPAARIYREICERQFEAVLRVLQTNEDQCLHRQYRCSGMPRNKLARGGRKRNALSLPSEAAIEAAGAEVKANPPASLRKQRRKKGKKAGERMRRAIVLSKARQNA